MNAFRVLSFGLLVQLSLFGCKVSNPDPSLKKPGENSKNLAKSKDPLEVDKNKSSSENLGKDPISTETLSPGPSESLGGNKPIQTQDNAKDLDSEKVENNGDTLKLETDTPAMSKATLFRFPTKEGRQLAYVSNRDVTKAAHTVETVIFVVHGIDRNPEVYYNSMLNAVRAQGLAEKTWVLAPFFMQEEDKPSEADLRWEDGNWKEGIEAKGMSGAAWSSYAMLDGLVRALNQPQRFSKLKSIYLVGFSAGGQFMQRYLVGTRVPDELKSFRFRFVVGAPGSYMYLTPDRKPAGKSSFAKPTICDGYDDFRYGINKRSDYLLDSSQADMIARVVYRDVRFIAGMTDTSRGGVLDVTCAADLQGLNRFTRAQTFHQYVKHLNPASKVKFFSVPGAAHEHEKVFKSSEGRNAIFVD